MNTGRRFNPLVAVFFALLLAGCSTSDNVKSKPMDEIVLLSADSGFGGTGRTQQVASIMEDSVAGHSMKLDSGFGGTGHTSSGYGGTGIIGTIEKFGSIWVNGVEVGLGQKTRIHSNIPGALSGLKASDLRLGQQVWLETNPDQDKTTTANIHIYYPLAGKIETMTAKPMATEIMINGQRVYIDEGTRLAKNLQLKVGEYVRVSGLPVFRQGTGERENAWQATLVEPQEGNVSWLKKQPDVQFSEKVQRVVMQDNWMTAYKAGELVHVPGGLSSQPKVKMIGPENVDGKLPAGSEAGGRASVDKTERDQRASVRPISSISGMRTPSPFQASPARPSSGRK